MNANEVIDSFVTDVAVLLPRKQRNDVAFELRALINEGLQDRAGAAGRAVDETMAAEFLRTFGRPETGGALLPDADHRRPCGWAPVLRAAGIGLAIVWGLDWRRSSRRPPTPDWASGARPVGGAAVPSSSDGWASCRELRDGVLGPQAAADRGVEAASGRSNSVAAERQ